MDLNSLESRNSESKKIVETPSLSTDHQSQRQIREIVTTGLEHQSEITQRDIHPRKFKNITNDQEECSWIEKCIHRLARIFHPTTIWKVFNQTPPEETLRTNSLMTAVSQGNVNEVRKLMKYDDTLIRTLDNDGSRALLLAAVNGHLEIMKYLIEECEVDPSARNSHGNNALFEAAFNGHLDICKYLVTECGIDPSIQNNYGETVILAAAGSGELDIIKYLVKEHGASVSIQNEDGINALMIAAQRGYLDVVKYLVEECRAEISTQNKIGENAITCAMEFPDVVHYLEQHADDSLRQHSEWGIKWKEGAHVLEMSGTLQYHQDLKVPLEGSYFDNYFRNKIARSFNKMGEDSPEPITKSIAKQIAKAIELHSIDGSDETIFKRWQSSELIILSTGYREHATSIIFYKNNCVFCDLSEKQPTPFQIFSFDISLFTPSIIRKLVLSKKQASAVEFKEYLSELYELLHMSKGDLETQLETIKQPLQVVNNCSWACLEGIIQPAFVLLALDKIEGPLSKSNVQKIIDEQHKIFIQWKEFHHEWRVVELHTIVKDINDPNLKVSEHVAAKVQKIWKDLGLPQIPIATIDTTSWLSRRFSHIIWNP